MNISRKVARALQVSSTSYPDTGSARQRVLKLRGLMLAALTVSGMGNALAADVYLQTQRFDKAMQGPGGSTVKMWGFAECTDATYSSCDTATAPGPEIRTVAGETLNIHVDNTLPVPVSVIVPGQASAGNAVTMPDATGRKRVRSFTHETAANSDSTVTGPYTISSPKAGTYLYQSGTVPQLQVPMGLYGALVVTDGSEPAVEALAVFSEIDPVQNSRVDAAATGGEILSENCVGLADYTASATAGYPCTIDYNPRHLLVNGGDGFNLAAAQGDAVMLRWANAGMKTHTPSIVGLDQSVIAEDGNRYPGEPRKQSVVLLGAGATKDALATMPASDITLSLFDRQPGFPNDSELASDATDTGPGSSLGAITVGVGSTTTTAARLAVNDEFDVNEDSSITSNVLINDAGSLRPARLLEVLSAPSHGTVTILGPNEDGDYNGRFTYTPDPDFSGVDQFTYQVGDGGTTVANAHVTLNVSYDNDAPSAQGDSYANTKGAAITVTAPGVLANDVDVDGDVLVVDVANSDSITGLTLEANGGLTYEGPSVPGFEYQACDQDGQCSTATVSLTTSPVSDIALTVENESGLPIPDYKWTVEEDTTWYPDPTQPPSNDILALNFHKSYMPVVAQGEGATEFASLALDENKRYYVTVLPTDGADENGHTTGAAQFNGNDSAVTVKVHTTPTEMAQISILIFNDNAPTNAAWDNGETGLGSFIITLEDAGGRYGASAGILSYDAFGEPLTNALDCFGTFTDSDGAEQQKHLPGIIQTCPDTPENQAAGLVGQVLIKNVYPGKYGVITSPPADQVTDWVQTSTIEGSKVIDAWVKAGEPAHFQEFGPPGWHIFTGFVNPAAINAETPAGTNPQVTGQVTNAHMSRPPAQLIADSGSYDALSHTRAWISVNSQAGVGPSVAVVQAEPDGSFELPSLPDGSYQLAIWDSFLDQVIAYRSFTVPGTTELGNIPVFNWFARMENTVFKDDGGTCGAASAENGIFDEACGELPLPEQNVSLRWRDGTVYQAAATDGEGYVPFDTVFPFFHWLVAEVDYARFKPTGVTVAADHGGEVDWDGNPFQYILNPQQQLPTDIANESTDLNVRTETGFVLTQGFQAFLGQTNVIDWGKVDWLPGENGGISGIVYYATTRAENDPRLGAAEPWEPGVAGATVRLYRKVTRPGAPATQGDLLVEGNYTITTDLRQLNNDTYRVQFGVMDLDQFVVLAEDYNSITRNVGTSIVRFSVPVSASNTYIGAPIAVRVFINGNTSADPSTITLNESGLVLVNETMTDNFDASVPEGCPGADPDDAIILGESETPVISTTCYDGIRNFNQVRPGVFDGGYAFNEDSDGNPLKSGKYVVEIVVPEGYEIVKEEDVNVAFGESYAQVPVPVLYPTGGTAEVPDTATLFVSSEGDVGIAQPHCVGAAHTVPAFMSLFPGMEEPAPFAGATRPLCDRKEVQLVDQGQAAADFMLATHAPIAGHFTGMILDDTATEFNARSPAFGEKWAPPYVPVAIRNAQGVEIGRVVSDQYGRYNGLVPSTISINLASPSGISPSMLVTCMNDPGPIPGPDGEMIIDPNFNPGYSNFCYTFQYMPGTTTYLDTPVVPVSAFASGYNPPDCALSDYTPKIKSVVTDQGDGPLVRPSTETVTHTVTLQSVGMASVPNPAYQGPLYPDNEPTITRNYGFGGEGTVTLDGAPLIVQSWSDTEIVVEAPIDGTTGQLLVTNAAGATTENGITLTVSNINENRVRRVPQEYATIQEAIDAADPTNIVMVSPGVYNERVIMWKPVRLQGSGSGATIINGALLDTGGMVGWREKMDCLYGIGTGCTDVVDSLPNQADGADGFLSEEGPTVTVVAPFDAGNGPGRPANRFAGRNARIDGFSFTGSSTGGGVFVNGYAHGLDITNNDVYSNSGGMHGGIRVGRPDLQLADPQTLVGDNLYDFNRNVYISYNIIRQNGSIGVAGPGGAGAGVSIAVGADNYRITDNYICGNFSLGNGGGIGHYGLSDNGRIERNTIVLNQTFDQAQNVSGGGVFIGGEPANGQALTYGAGDVFISDNLIQGNQAGSGHGGGIRLQNINGADVANTVRFNQIFRARVFDNVIVNNVAEWSGGGVSMVDALRVVLRRNTISHNDSTATVGNLIDVTGTVNSSVNQPAGLVSELNSPALEAEVQAKTHNSWNNYKAGFSSPFIRDNIITQNRSFNYYADMNIGPELQPALSPTAAGSCDGGTAVYWDVAVLDSSLTLNVHGSNTTGADPAFVEPYCNGARWGAGPMNVHPTVDEGGADWIDVRYGPLDVRGDYSVAP